jgi:hypothetical protein
MEGLPQLPWDSIGVIARYLYACQQTSFFKCVSRYWHPAPASIQFRMVAEHYFFFCRFCLIDKQHRERGMKFLDYVMIDFELRPSVADHAGAQPIEVTFYELPLLHNADDEIMGMTQLLNRVQSLSVYLTGMPESAPLVFSPLGPHLTNLTRLEVINEAQVENLVFIKDWMPYTKNLSSLKMPWTEDTGGALSHAGQLRELFLCGDTDLSISYLTDSLTKFTDLKLLTLPGVFEEMDRMREHVQNGDVDALALELSNLSEHVPPHMADLSALFLQMDRGETVVAEVHVFGELYREATDADILKYLALRLKQIGANVSCGPDCETPLTSSLGFGTAAPGKIKLLIEMGANPWHLHSIICPSGARSVGNALHYVSMYGSSEMAEQLLSCIDLPALSIDQLRLTTGYTPLHLMSRQEDTWDLLYEELVQFFPDILADRQNVNSATTIVSIHLFQDDELFPWPTIVSRAKTLLFHRPSLIQESGPSILPALLAFYFESVPFAPLDGADNSWEQVKSLLTQVLDSTPDLLPLQTGLALETTLDFKESHFLAGALLYFPTLAPKFFSGKSVGILSAALRAIVCRNFADENLEDIMNPLLEYGADINSYDQSVQHNASCLAFLVHRTREIEDENNLDWDILWKNILFMLGKGAVCIHRGRVSHIFGFITPKDFARTVPSSEGALKFVNTLLAQGGSAQRSDAVAFVKALHEAYEHKREDFLLEPFVLCHEAMIKVIPDYELLPD